MTQTKLIGEVFITQEELAEALSSIYDDIGISITMLSDKDKMNRISNYWKTKGKQSFKIN